MNEEKLENQETSSTDSTKAESVGKSQSKRQQSAKAESVGKSQSKRQQSAKASVNSSNTQPPSLLRRYREEFAPQLMKEFGYTVLLQVPRLEKIVMNVGLGEALTNSNAIDNVTQMLTAISGQKPVVTKAKKSIAGFKIREGMQIGAMVTLRGRRMYEFAERLTRAALPRIRDFRGVPANSFDGQGNYSFGIREQMIFPEIDYNRIDRIRSFQVTFVTTAQKDQEAFRLLELFGVPFAKVSGN